MSNIKDVEEFHKKFGLYYDGKPRSLPEYDGIRELRVNFLYEELAEYETALRKEDLTKQFDALQDLVYVALGNAQLQGFAPIWIEGWGFVHSANMTKERAQKSSQSTRNHTFDVVKPKNFVPPDGKLEELIERLSA